MPINLVQKLQIFLISKKLYDLREFRPVEARSSL